MPKVEHGVSHKLEKKKSMLIPRNSFSRPQLRQTRTQVCAWSTYDIEQQRSVLSLAWSICDVGQPRRRTLGLAWSTRDVGQPRRSLAWSTHEIDQQRGRALGLETEGPGLSQALTFGGRLFDLHTF